MPWHILLLKFSISNITCIEQKEPINIQFVRLLSALMKVHPISHAVFETTRSGFIKTLHHCSMSWKINPLYFFGSNLIYFGQKESIKVKFFRLLRGRVKFEQIPHVIFESTSQFFFKLCITLQCHERWLSYAFLAETLYGLDKAVMQNLKKNEFVISKRTRI